MSVGCINYLWKFSIRGAQCPLTPTNVGGHLYLLTEGGQGRSEGDYTHLIISIMTSVGQ